MSRLPHIPEYIPGTRNRMQYIRIKGNEPEEKIRRVDFMELVNHAADDPREHTYPELDAGYVYYIDEPNEEMRKENLKQCLAADRDRKRYERAHQCPYIGTKKCSGWKREEVTGHCGCDVCPYREQVTEISTDAYIVDVDGEEDSFGSTLPSTEPTPEEIVMDEYIHKQYYRLLKELPEEDRLLVIAANQPHVDYGEIARRFGLSDRTYASKKAHRIEERLRKAVEKLKE